MAELNWHGPELALAQGHIYVVEDDAGMRDSIKLILLSLNYRVRLFSDPAKFLEAVTDQFFPSMLLLDMRLPKLTGLDVQAALCERGIDFPIVFMSGESTVSQAVNALEAGAAKFLVKPVTRATLVDAVVNSLKQERERVQEQETQLRMDRMLSRLTSREREVLSCLKRGMGNAEIAETLNIAVPTAKQHKANIMIKFDAKTRTELFDFLNQS